MLARALSQQGHFWTVRDQTTRIQVPFDDESGYFGAADFHTSTHEPQKVCSSRTFTRIGPLLIPAQKSAAPIRAPCAQEHSTFFSILLELVHHQRR